MKKVILLILFFAAFQAQAQDNLMERVQLMEQEIASGNFSDDEMFEKYIQLINLYSGRDFDKTKLYFQKGLDFAREKKRVEWEARYWGRMGDVYRSWGTKDSVLICLDRAAKLIEGKDNYLFESQIFSAIGSFYDDLNQNEKALSAYFHSLELVEKDRNIKLSLNQNVADNNLRQAHITHNIGTLYYGLRNLEKAVEYMLRAKQILDENPHDSNSFIENYIYLNLASYYEEMGQTDKVLPNLLKAYELTMAQQNNDLLVFLLRKLSDYYRSEKDFKQALQYAKETLQIAEQTQNPQFLNWADVAMMKTSIDLNDNQTALYYATRIEERASDDDWTLMQTLHNGLILIYSSMNNPVKIAENLKKLDDITAKISNKNLHDALQEMEVKYDVQQKDFELERQQAKIDRQRTRQYLYIGGLMAAGVLLALLVYNVRLRTRRNLALSERNDTLAEMNVTKDKFFSIISHDLRNPAVAQRDALQMLVEKSHLWDNYRLTSYYRDLLKSADGQVELLFNLLGWAKIQTKRMTYTPATFAFSDLLPEIALVRKMADNKGVSFDVAIADHALVKGDIKMLAVVVRNLLTNAVKFTPAGGEVTLAVEPDNKGHYTVSVSDTGTGMSREQIEKLFRLDSAQSRKGTSGEEGSGLGLIVCKELVEMHGKTLHVESEEGKGSKFWFELR